VVNRMMQFPSVDLHWKLASSGPGYSCFLDGFHRFLDIPYYDLKIHIMHPLADPFA